MRKDVDNNTYTYYYYDGLTVLAEKKKVGAGNPTWDKLFTVAPGAIGNILSSNLNYYHYDAMGNVVFIADFDGTPAQSFEQEAYGNVKSGSQSGYHLTTKEYDTIPELYYFWQRWYDPMLGTFLSLDPKSRSILPYNLCKNNSINSIDPQGLYTVDKSCDNSGLGEGGGSSAKSREEACKEHARRITDEKLRKCVENMCDKATIKCQGCEGPCKPYPGEGGNIIYPIGYPGYDSNSIIMCQENIKFCGFNNNNTLYDIIVHEFSHLCGWVHSQTGKGVPFETGGASCKGNNSGM